jgi:hypothetical protein
MATAMAKLPTKKVLKPGTRRPPAITITIKNPHHVHELIFRIG